MIIYPGRMLPQNSKRKLEKMKPGGGDYFFTKDSLEKVWVTKESFFYSFNLIKVTIYANLGVSSKYFNIVWTSKTLNLPTVLSHFVWKNFLRKKCLKIKEFCLCHKLKFSKHCIFATWRCKSFVSQQLKYLMQQNS